MHSGMDDVLSKLKLLDLPAHVLKVTVKELIEAGAPEVPENEVQENTVDATASGDMEVTEKGAGMEAAPRHPRDGSELDGLSEPGEGAQLEPALEEGLAALSTTPNEEGRVAIKQQHEGCDGSPSFPTAGNENATERAALGEGNRKKRKNWPDPEDTDKLLEAVSKKKKNVGSTRMDKCNAASELPYWEAIAEEVPGKTGDECRMRVDTLKKSYITIKKYSDHEPQKNFKELMEIFPEMQPKLSPRLTEDWYNQIRDHCPPRPKEKLRAGSSSKSRGSAPSASSFGLQPPMPTGASSSKRIVIELLDAGSSNVVIRAPDGIDPSNLPMAVLERVISLPRIFQMQTVSSEWLDPLAEGPADAPPSPEPFPIENQLLMEDVSAESASFDDRWDYTTWNL